MKTKYADIESEFYTGVKDYIHSRHQFSSKELDVLDSSTDIMMTLKTISGHSSWFAAKDDSNNYHAYFAFLEVYHAICDYVKNGRQDNKRLEKALKNWRAVINPKCNILSLIQEFIKKRQK